MMSGILVLLTANPPFVLIMAMSTLERESYEPEILQRREIDPNEIDMKNNRQS